MLTSENNKLATMLIVEAMFSMRREDSSCGESNILANF